MVNQHNQSTKINTIAGMVVLHFPEHARQLAPYSSFQEIGTLQGIS
jgi:hypothetical protein